MLGLQGQGATSSRLRRTRVGLWKLRLGCELGLLNSMSCTQAPLKAVQILGKGSPLHSHGPHIYPGIPRFSTATRGIQICLQPWFSTRGNFTPQGTCGNDCHLAFACLSCRTL